jgi:hypothetical protein
MNPTAIENHLRFVLMDLAIIISVAGPLLQLLFPLEPRSLPPDYEEDEARRAKRARREGELTRAR